MKANTRNYERRIKLLQQAIGKLSTDLALAESRLSAATDKQILLMNRLIEAEETIKVLRASQGKNRR